MPLPLSSRFALFLASFSLGLSLAAPAFSGTWDGKPKILLHVAAPTSKSCPSDVLPDCGAAVTAGAVGSGYFVYLVAAKGDLPNLAGIECGLMYGTGGSWERNDHHGVDVLSWNLCAALEFPTPVPHAWPAPGSGNLITWNTTGSCQTGETSVAGYFYVAAYSDDVLSIIPRPASGNAKVATCQLVEWTLAPADLGRARFSGSASQPGCNPCVAACGATSGFELCSVSPLALDFGDVMVGDTSLLDVHILNHSGSTLTGTVTENGLNFSISGDPSYSVDPGGTAVVQVAYHPVASGTETCIVDPGNGCPPIPASAHAIPALACGTSPASIDFGYVPVGQSADRTFTVENHGNQDFDVNLQACYTWWVDPQYSIVGAKSLHVPAGGSVTSTVRYTPSEKAPAACQISTGLAACALIELQGTGFPDVGCLATPDRLDFGEGLVGQTRWATLLVQNLGGPPISGTVSFLTNPGHQFSISGNANYTLTAGHSQYFSITCRPEGAGSLEGLLDPGCGDPIPCYAYGQPTSTLTAGVSPTTLNFSYVALGDTAYLPFTVLNSGTTRLTGRVGESCPDFFVPEPDIDLGPRESDTLLVVFVPTVRNLQTCAIHVPGGQSVICSGNTVALPFVAIQPDFLNFGSVQPGDSAMLPLSFTNNGTAPVGGAIEESCAEFSVSDPSIAIAPGESRTITITFKPSSTVRQQCDLAVLNRTIRCVANQAVAVIPTTWSDIKTRYGRR